MINNTDLHSGNHTTHRGAIPAREDDAVKAAVIHQLRDKWWTPDEAAAALNLPLSTVQHWWSTNAENATWTPGDEGAVRECQRLIELHG